MNIFNMGLTKMRLSILASVLVALLAGIAIGRYSFSGTKVSEAKRTTALASKERSTAVPPPSLVPAEKETRSTIASKGESETVSTEQLIDKVKAALARPGN